ncbi:hypothetical protein [Agrobacterium rosae]
MILTTRHNYDLFNNQLQQGVFQPKPMRIYSLRKDSTAGGNGACRWEDPTTWESSDNLADLAYTVARGLYYRGRWVHGGRNFSTYRLPASAWMAAANVCDIDVGGRRQYRGGLEVFVDSQPIEVIEDLRVGCSGRFAEVGGQLKLLCGAPGAPVYSFTDESIVVTQDQGFEPFASVSSTHNTITGVYPEPAQLWATKDAPEYSVPALLIRDDGQKLPIGMEYDAVPFSAQVQALMKTDLEESQRWRVHEAFFGPEARALEPNDPIAYTSVRNSYSNKLFIVVRATPSDGLKTRVMFKEWEPSDYQPPSIFVPPVIGPVGSTPLPPQIMSGWTVAPAIISNASSTSQRPSIKVGCAPDLDGVERVWVKVRRASDHAIVFDSDSTRYAAPFEWILNGTFTPNTDYEVAGEYVSNINRNQEQSAWLPVRTPNVLFDSADILAGAITAEKIADAAVNASKLMNEAVTSLKLADQAVSTAKLQVGAVTAAIIANQAVDITKFASGLEPVSIVAAGALPTVKTTTNITWQGELYTWNGSAYAKPQTGVADGSITAAKLADAAVTADKLANSAVTHDKIVTGAIYGDLIAAQSITARELILTDFSNVVDAGWQKGSLSGWSTNGLISFVNDQAAGDASGWKLQSNARDQAFSVSLAANPSDTWYFEVWVNNADAVSANLMLLIRNPAGSAISYPVIAATSVKNTWVKLSGQYTMPAGYTSFQVLLQTDRSTTGGGTTSWTKPVARRAANASLIVDGAITALKISAGAVTADAISANAITTAKIMAGAVNATQIAAGAITTEKLAVGLGKNWLTNSDLSAGLQNWGGEFTNAPAGTWAIGIRADNYGVRPYGSLELTYNGSDPNIVVGVWQKNADASVRSFPVAAGQWLELSGKYLGHRTTNLRAYVQFLDASGNHLSYASVADFPASQNTNPNYSLAGYQSFFAKVLVPTGATQARPFWRMNGVVNGQTNPYLWLTNLFFGLATAQQTEASIWSDGGITIIGPGNLVTGAVTADKIGALAVTAGKIAANAVTATEIAANAITAAKIVGGSITGDKLVVNSITSRELLITDFTNIIPNGDFASGDFSSNWQKQPGNASDNIGYIEGGSFSLNGSRSLLLQKQTATTSAHACSVITPDPIYIPLEGGAAYAVESSVWSNVGSSPAGFYVIVHFYDGPNKTYLGSNNTIDNRAVSGTRANYRGKFTAPANARFAKVQVVNNSQNTTTDNFIVDYVYLRKANAASLIVDGSITAAQIAANSITADKLQVTSLAAISATLGNVNIENAIIGNLQVGTSNIAAGAVTAVEDGVRNVTINHGLNAPKVRVDYSLIINFHPTQNAPSVNIFLSSQDGTMENFIANGQQGKTVAVTRTKIFIPPASRASTSFNTSFDTNGSQIIGESIIATAFKR